MCSALCFLPRFDNLAFEIKASEASKMQPLTIHLSLIAAVSFGPWVHISNISQFPEQTSLILSASYQIIW